MPARLVAVTFDAHDVSKVASFWGTLLDRDVERRSDGVLLPGTPAQVGLRFAEESTPRARPSHLHLHLTTESGDDEVRTVERAQELGAQHLDVGQLPEEDHVVLADPDGNPFCVIGHRNRFLAGCGRLGEVACDGGRDVGLFWAEALGWPLVWDQDQETAVQSHEGGTKLSWGGPPETPKLGRNRQRFHLAAVDLGSEVTRLAALGATTLDVREGAAELADPEGNEFLVVQD
jgi:catechol 2,3-dioxygenase-like lactoylglutathione lyase family enzyme